MIEKWQHYRSKIVVRGNLDVVVFLGNLPPTRHDLDSFIVDVSMVTVSFVPETVKLNVKYTWFNKGSKDCSYTYWISYRSTYSFLV
jgi:hypothetical protein